MTLPKHTLPSKLFAKFIHTSDAFSFTLVSLLIFFLPTIKFSYIVGSFFNFFSLKNSLVPLSGAFGGAVGSTILHLFRLLVGFLNTGTVSLKLLAFYIPGLFGSLYWSSRSAFIRLFIPILCMTLFCLHPVGYAAAPYTLYWFIPILLYSLPTQSLFLESLGATFVMHAVGSVIWLYTVPMTSAQWLALIPLVILERILLALTMTISHKAISYTSFFIKTLFNTHSKTHLPNTYTNLSPS